MSKLYLHKYKKEYLKTTKNTIIADIDKLNDDYKYEKGISKKEPKELIITGKINEDFTFGTNIFGLPVEKVIIDCNIHSHYTSLKAFEKAKDLEITDNAKRIEIFGNYGLKNIENITIPFNIKNFDNNYFDNNYIYVNKIKTITIKYNDLVHVIELDDVFKEKRIDISITNSNNILNININGNYSNVNYKVYIEDNELKSIKNYSRYEIIPNNFDTVLDLIELRKKIDAKFTSNSFLNYESMIVSKKDYDFLTNMTIGKGQLKEIIIKDDNDMTLFPRKAKIDINTYLEYLHNVEVIDGILLLAISAHHYQNIRYVFVNEDLSVINLNRKYSEQINPIIDEVVIDFNTKKFSERNEDGHYIITIPLNIERTINDSKILTAIFNLARKITIKNNDNEINIPNFIYSYDFRISNIKRYKDDSFGILYDEIISGGVRKYSECIIYDYDMKTKSYKSNKDFNVPYIKQEIEKDRIKKLTKK